MKQEVDVRPRFGCNTPVVASFPNSNEIVTAQKTGDFSTG